jgi:hypothetical protein
MLQIWDNKHGVFVTYKNWKEFRSLNNNRFRRLRRRLLLVRQMMAGHQIEVYWPIGLPPARRWDFWRYCQGLDPEEIGLRDYVTEHRVHRQVN